MNYENYDPRFISNGEVIGAYFLNTFYNELYIKARQSVAAAKYASITDAYRAMVTNYTYGIESPELCNKVIQGLHKYYQDKTNYSVITLSEFEGKILSQFIPPEYYRDFTGRDKDSNLCAIIRRTVNMFGNKLLEKKYLSMVIDERKIQTNIRILQDVILSILVTQREEYYTNFARKITQKQPNMVSDEVVEKLRSALVDMTRKKCSVEQERDTAINILRQVALKVREIENNSARNSYADSMHSSAQSVRPSAGASSKNVLTHMSTLHPDNILNTPPRRPTKPTKSTLLTESEIKETLSELSAPVIKLSKEDEFMTARPQRPKEKMMVHNDDDDDDEDEPDDIADQQRNMIMNRFNKAPTMPVMPPVPTQKNIDEITDVW